MTVSCEYVSERLSAYIDGECTAEEELNIRAHLEGCDECTALLNALKDTSVWTSDALQTPIPKTLHEDILSAVQEARARNEAKKIKFSRRWSTVAVAASLLLCVFGTVIAYVNSERLALQAQNSMQKAMPMQQGFVYDMQTKWSGGALTFSIPEEIRFYEEGKNNWKSNASTGMQWSLTVDMKTKTAVLSNSLIEWNGIVSSSEKGVPTCLQFGNLMYRVDTFKGGILLILEEE